MANSLEIPAVVGCPGVCDACKTGDTLALDALDGVVEINPDEATIAKYEAKAEAFLKEKEELKVLKNEKSVTKDGHEVELAGNIGGFKDVEGVLTMVVKVSDYSVQNSIHGFRSLPNRRRTI